VVSELFLDEKYSTLGYKYRVPDLLSVADPRPIMEICLATVFTKTFGLLSMQLNNLCDKKKNSRVIISS
jgi:hypothetical protein